MLVAVHLLVDRQDVPVHRLGLIVLPLPTKKTGASARHWLNNTKKEAAQHWFKKVTHLALQQLREVVEVLGDLRVLVAVNLPVDRERLLVQRLGLVVLPLPTKMRRR